ncbi:MAG: hypothetical protein KGJ80_12830 [Chloroflexota bacterium]|nr:hypothetical protein [Chloroflexota bacterium]
MAISILLVLLLVLAVITARIAVATYGLAWLAQHGSGGVAAATNPITPITAMSTLATFLAIVILTRGCGVKIALGSALLGTMAGPWIFELPFDLIVMSRIHIVPSPAALYGLLYFLPLFLIELLTFALLTLSPAMQVSRYTLFSLAAMFLVFAVWAWFGFSEPSTPLPIVFNAVSKVLAFAAVVTLFLPGKRMLADNPVQKSVLLEKAGI